MANPEHLKIMKRGVRAWNQWRYENPNIKPDLSRARLSSRNLVNVDLRDANLSHAVLDKVILKSASLSGAQLMHASLSEAALDDVHLIGANLVGVSLLYANLVDVELGRANLSEAVIGSTTLANIDLSTVIGLDTVIHIAPSTIGVDTIYRSRGKIPEEFLRGCGVPDGLVTYMRAISEQPHQFYSCFISYSSRDQGFVERLRTDLQSKGVRCWFAPEDLKIGDRFRDKIDESIRLHDKLLLILSENSVSSQWVSDEVEAAFERERRENRTVLFPIKIDEAVTESEKSWAATIRRTRHIGDFTRWKQHDSYQKSFERLLRDLKAE